MKKGRVDTRSVARSDTTPVIPEHAHVGIFQPFKSVFHFAANCKPSFSSTRSPQVKNSMQIFDILSALPHFLKIMFVSDRKKGNGVVNTEAIGQKRNVFLVRIKLMLVA